MHQNTCHSILSTLYFCNVSKSKWDFFFLPQLCSEGSLSIHRKQNNWVNYFLSLWHTCSAAVEPPIKCPSLWSSRMIQIIWKESEIIWKLYLNTSTLSVLLPSCNVFPITTARSAGAGRQLCRFARAEVDAWGHFLEGTETFSLWQSRQESHEREMCAPQLFHLKAKQNFIGQLPNCDQIMCSNRWLLSL